MDDRSEPPWEPGPDADEGYALFAKEGRAVADDGTPIAYTFRNPGGAGCPSCSPTGGRAAMRTGASSSPLEAAATRACCPTPGATAGPGCPAPPGRGAREPDIDDLSMPRIARDLAAALDEAGVDEALVVGHSMGVQTSSSVPLGPRPGRRAGAHRRHADNPAKTFYGTSIGDHLSRSGRAGAGAPEVLAPALGHDRPGIGRPPRRPAGPGRGPEGDARGPPPVPPAPRGRSIRRWSC